MARTDRAAQLFQAYFDAKDVMGLKTKKKKKQQTPLQKIQKQLDKLSALHAKEEEIVATIEEVIEEAEYEDD